MLTDWLPFLFVLLLIGGALSLSRLIINRASGTEKRLPRQLLRIALVLVGAVVLVVALPTRDDGLLTDQTKGNLLSLLGLAITALITLSSTTIAANGMAGLMLRAVSSYKLGDFIRVEDNFGRVTERGLFHTEIQTEDRDLLTLPNLYLATTPVRVVHATGTIISAEVGLGYDVSHARIEALLNTAGEAAGLTDTFVLITQLNDHAITYRVAGFLSEIKTLVSARSVLHAAILDTLHAARVEIVSPGFIYQRQTDATQRIIPKPEARRGPKKKAELEQIAFDKADAAEQLVQLRETAARLETAIKELTRKVTQADESEKHELEREQALLEAELTETRQAIDDAEAASKPAGNAPA